MHHAVAVVLGPGVVGLLSRSSQRARAEAAACRRSRALSLGSSASVATRTGPTTSSSATPPPPASTGLPAGRPSARRCSATNPSAGRAPPGLTEPATQVDHIVGVALAPERAFDPTNLQPLCTVCHAWKSASERRGTGVDPGVGGESSSRGRGPRAARGGRPDFHGYRETPETPWKARISGLLCVHKTPPGRPDRCP